MQLQRIQREIRETQAHFPNVEAVPTTAGGLYVQAALQTTVGKIYILAVTFNNYPSEMPKVSVLKPQITHGKHQYMGGAICYMHPNMWNPGLHDLRFVLAQVAVWLNKHEVYSQLGYWPGPELKHN